MATPEEGSREPKTRTLIVTPVAGFVTLTLSPGRYPTVFANSPRGNTPSSATTALPSREGFVFAKSVETKIRNNIICVNRFIVKSFFNVSIIYHLRLLFIAAAICCAKRVIPFSELSP